MAFISADEIKDLQENLSNSPFIHGILSWTNKKSATKVMHEAYICTNPHDFKVIWVDTCCIVRIIISFNEYGSYWRVFGLKKAMRPHTGKAIAEIGGVQIPIGATNIQIPFKKLNLIIDVDFVVLEYPVPTLL